MVDAQLIPCSMPADTTNLSERPLPAYTGWGLALGASLFVAALASSTPFLPVGARSIVMHMFSSVCHQLPDRSPHVDGIQLAACHRCMGIYWAIPVAALLYRSLRGRWPFRGRQAAWFLFAAVLPACVDWGVDILGWWSNTPATRAATGALFGLAAGYYLARALGEIRRDTRLRAVAGQKKMT
jgi:uncharacterized membrane protein